MAYSVWQAFITDGGEAIVPAATLTVFFESSGAPAIIYDGPAGTSLGNTTVSGEDGLARFYAPASTYKIVATKGAFTKEFRHVQLGNAQSRDVGTAADQLPTKADVDSLITAAAVGRLNDRGDYDASTNLFPATGGSGSAGAVLKGDMWRVSVAGTLGGVAAAVDDWFRALVDTPAQTSANWALNKGADHFKGSYASLAALQAAFPVGKLGDYATVDAGSGSDASWYFWDADEGWVTTGGAGFELLDWDVESGTILTEYTLDAVPAAFGQVAFPTVSGQTHGFEVSGSNPTDFGAITAEAYAFLVADTATGDLLIPSADYLVHEFQFNTDASDTDAPVTMKGLLFAFDPPSTPLVGVTATFEISSGGNWSVNVAGSVGATSMQAINDTGSLPLSAAIPVMFYVHGATRRIGVKINGTDHGFIVDNATGLIELAISEAVGQVMFIESGDWAGDIEAGSPQFEKVFSIYNTATEANFIQSAPGTVADLIRYTGPIALPGGAAKNDVFAVRTINGETSGSFVFQGKTWTINDLAIVIDDALVATRIPFAAGLTEAQVTALAAQYAEDAGLQDADEVAALIAAALASLGSSGVANQSTIAGTTVTAALNVLSGGASIAAYSQSVTTPQDVDGSFDAIHLEILGGTNKRNVVFELDILCTDATTSPPEYRLCQRKVVYAYLDGTAETATLRPETVYSEHIGDTDPIPLGVYANLKINWSTYLGTGFHVNVEYYKLVAFAMKYKVDIRRIDRGDLFA